MENVQLKVDGMSCTNCALSIHKYLESEGVVAPKVNFMEGEVNFELPFEASKEKLIKGINSLGYKVRGSEEKITKRFLDNNKERAIFCLIFTLPLMIHMIPGVHIHFLMNPFVQLGITLPVYIVGMSYFGKSAWNSIFKGIPNMNVLVAIGATAAFGYSLYGTLIGQGAAFAYYETAATILTLVFFGNYLEDASIESTQRALKDLVKAQKVMANMIVFDEHHKEVIFNVESNTLKVGDIILINAGETVPMDSKILWGEASVNEAIVTGESVPIHRKTGEILLGGSTIENGTIKAYVTAVGDDTVLANILKMVKNAQGEKPPVQILADKISAIFVPLVLGIALVTLLGNFFFTSIGFGESMLRAIAVLVISCPCAMGLATPAAIAVGLGRGARNGVIFKNAKSLETFKDIKQVVFDKTGTLTNDQIFIEKIFTNKKITEKEALVIASTLSASSLHPVSRAFMNAAEIDTSLKIEKIEEVSGGGLLAKTSLGIFKLGSLTFCDLKDNEFDHLKEEQLQVHLMHDDYWVASFMMTESIKEDALQSIKKLKQHHLNIQILSGDKLSSVKRVADQLSIQNIKGQCSPEDKLRHIQLLQSQHSKVLMVGDGLNDGPVLAFAHASIALGQGAPLSQAQSDFIILKGELRLIPQLIEEAKRTMKIIKQNLVWAALYNLICIPLAVMGFLPAWLAGLGMALSSLFVILNAARLAF